MTPNLQLLGFASKPQHGLCSLYLHWGHSPETLNLHPQNSISATVRIPFYNGLQAWSVGLLEVNGALQHNKPD